MCCWVRPKRRGRFASDAEYSQGVTSSQSSGPCLGGLGLQPLLGNRLLQGRKPPWPLHAGQVIEHLQGQRDATHPFRTQVQGIRRYRIWECRPQISTCPDLGVACAEQVGNIRSEEIEVLLRPHRADVVGVTMSFLKLYFQQDVSCRFRTEDCMTLPAIHSPRALPFALRPWHREGVARVVLDEGTPTRHHHPCLWVHTEGWPVRQWGQHERLADLRTFEPRWL